MPMLLEYYAKLLMYENICTTAHHSSIYTFALFCYLLPYPSPQSPLYQSINSSIHHSRNILLKSTFYILHSLLTLTILRIEHSIPFNTHHLPEFLIASNRKVLEAIYCGQGPPCGQFCVSVRNSLDEN
jgi:hypothetical protein